MRRILVLCPEEFSKVIASILGDEYDAERTEPYSANYLLHRSCEKIGDAERKTAALASRIAELEAQLEELRATSPETCRCEHAEPAEKCPAPSDPEKCAAKVRTEKAISLAEAAEGRARFLRQIASVLKEGKNAALGLGLKGGVTPFTFEPGIDADGKACFFSDHPIYGRMRVAELRIGKGKDTNEGPGYNVVKLHLVNADECPTDDVPTLLVYHPHGYTSGADEAAAKVAAETSPEGVDAIESLRSELRIFANSVPDCSLRGFFKGERKKHAKRAEHDIARIEEEQRRLTRQAEELARENGELRGEIGRLETLLAAKGVIDHPLLSRDKPDRAARNGHLGPDDPLCPAPGSVPELQMKVADLVRDFEELRGLVRRAVSEVLEKQGR